MRGKIYQYLADDHDRLDDYFSKANANPNEINMEYYDKFRYGLLRHIGIEEKIILPSITKYQNGKPADITEQLRLDHSAIATMFVPPPDQSIIATIEGILKVHNPMEEDEGGLYDILERLAGADYDMLLEKMIATPDVLVMPYREGQSITDSMLRVVARSGRPFIQVK